MNKQFDQIVYSPNFENRISDIKDNELSKLQEAITVHGYRGPSKKKHNGVVPIRPTDKNLFKYHRIYLEGEDKEVQKDFYVNLNSRALTPHLGAKVEIRLYNGQIIVGYLEMANNRSIKISQLKYKGKTILPFAFKDIKSVLLLRSSR